MVKKYFFILFGITVIVFSAIMFRDFSTTRNNQELRAKVANLIVYTHSSFMDSYGPGPELKKEFEKFCDCTVNYVDAGGASMAAEKIKLDPKRRVDLLLGLDHLLLSKIAKTIPLQTLSRPDINFKKEIVPFIYERFLPYDWSPMGIVYRASDSVPFASLAEALDNMKAKSLTLQDPTLSSPGLEFLYWMFLQPGNLAKQLEKVNRVVHSYSPSWSTSYGLFKKKQAQYTFSYLTSLIYHWQEENDRNYQFMVFREGHPAQIEYAAVPEVCWNCGAAKNFIKFMLSSDGQKIIAQKNYMLPVRDEVSLSREFSELPKVYMLGPERLDEFANSQSAQIDIWKKARR